MFEVVKFNVLISLETTMTNFLTLAFAFKTNMYNFED